MKRVTKFYKRLWKEERGAALMLVGATLVVLMGMAAFGSDLAWFYLNASRIQRTADAAALGGVVWLPDNEAQAFATAWNLADQNQYVEPDRNNPTMVFPERVTGELNQLKVTVTDVVPTFFLKVFGINEQRITREAVAQYIPPLKLGSPSNRFGNDPSCWDPVNRPDCSGSFWSNIHGTRTQTGYGDAYSSYCAQGTSGNGCPRNPLYRNHGYLFGIDPQGASSVTLEQLDATYHNDTGGVNNGDGWRTGDHDAHLAGANPGQSVTVNVYYPDPTPLDISNNSIYCSHTFAPLAQITPNDAPPFNYAANWVAHGKGWASVCGGAIDTSSSPDGIWVVQVVANTGAAPGITFASGSRFTNDANTAISGVNQSGLNRYSLRTSTGSLFALGDFAVFNNFTGSTTAFYLAEVPSFYRGKTFVIEMYDTAEFSGSGSARLQPISPATGLPFNSGTCRLFIGEGNPIVWTPRDTTDPGETCEDVFGAGFYEGRWLKFEIDLPPNYACGGTVSDDCWWMMNYVYPTGSTANDTTTWRAYMLGNPIHLVR